MSAKKSLKRVKRAHTPVKHSSPRRPASMQRLVLERMAFLLAAGIMALGIIALSPLSLLGKNVVPSRTPTPLSFPPAPTPPSVPVPDKMSSDNLLRTAAPAILTPITPFLREYTTPTDKYPTPTPGQLAPLMWRVTTDQPVVFLTIDDGIVKDPRAIAFMQEHHLVATLFLANTFIEEHYDYFKNLTLNGSMVEDHTLNHQLDLYKKSYDVQKAEICGAADLYTRIYGRRPVLYRPPGGSYTVDTQRAAADCGMKAVVIWHAKVDGGAVQWQDGDQLLPGDIVLMHFRPAIIEDLTAFTKAVNDAHLRVALLEDWFE